MARSCLVSSIRADSPQPFGCQLTSPASLITTLPDLIDKALQNRYGDATLRYTCPLASRAVEQSTDPNRCIVTLGTADGFGVRFSHAARLGVLSASAAAQDNLC